MEDWVLSIPQEKPLDLTELFGEYQYVKQSHWEYEHEWRVLTYKRPGDDGLFADWRFNVWELTGIYVGSKMPAEEAAVLRALLRYGFEHVRMFRSVEDQRTLALRFEQA
jgi:hypothetical protein